MKHGEQKFVFRDRCVHFGFWFERTQIQLLTLHVIVDMNLGFLIRNLSRAIVLYRLAIQIRHDFVI